MKKFIYTDASFDKKNQLAVLGHMIFKNETEHNTMSAVNIPISLFDTYEVNNIRAEIKSALMALSSFLINKTDTSQIVLFTDCQTICGLMERREKLERLNFMSQSKKKLLANADLYQEFYKIYDILKPQIIWIKGHKQDLKSDKIDKNFSVLDKAVRQHLRKKIKDL